MTVFDRLSMIEKGTVLYYVYAMDKPRSLEGEETLIAVAELLGCAAFAARQAQAGA